MEIFNTDAELRSFKIKIGILKSYYVKRLLIFIAISIDNTIFENKIMLSLLVKCDNTTMMTSVHVLCTLYIYLFM